MEYTEIEILKILGKSQAKRLGRARLIPMCRRAGLIIEATEDPYASRGRTIKYKIIADNRKNNIKWVDCIYQNDYEVSEDGDIRAKKNQRMLGFKDGKGYMKFTGINKQVGIHRAIFFSFHPEYFKDEQLYTVDHINGIRTDNRLSNLRLLSRLENIEEMDKNQTNLKEIMAKLLPKYGYKELEEKLNSLL